MGSIKVALGRQSLGNAIKYQALNIWHCDEPGTSKASSLIYTAKYVNCAMVGHRCVYNSERDGGRQVCCRI